MIFYLLCLCRINKIKIIIKRYQKLAMIWIDAWMGIFGYEFHYSSQENDLHHPLAVALLHPIPHFRLITPKIINLFPNEGNLHQANSFHSVVVMADEVIRINRVKNQLECLFGDDEA